MKNYSKKRAKKEKNRHSIIFDDLTKCAFCGSTFNIDKNEVFEGAKRNASIAYGFIVPLCRFHHDLFHNNRDFNLYYKRMFQQEFEKNYSRDTFMQIIHRNYL